MTGLSPATTYYARAYAENTAGTAYGDAVSFTTSIEVPEAPVATDATVVTETGFTVNWNAVAGADGYRLDVATSYYFSGYFGYYYYDYNFWKNIE